MQIKCERNHFPNRKQVEQTGLWPTKFDHCNYAIFHDYENTRLPWRSRLMENIITRKRNQPSPYLKT